MTVLDYQTLKARQRAARESFPPALALRTHRALSWLQRAEQETQDPDARFVFLWIAFNAAYANEILDRREFPEQKLLANFLGRLVEIDQEKLLYRLLWDEYPGAIRVLIDNPFVFAPFWECQKGLLTATEWRDRFERSRAWTHGAIGRTDALGVLLVVFERLYTLRNQLIHGGATWNGATNRDQVRDSVKIMDCLVPIVVHLMMDAPDKLWGDPSYPVVDNQ